MNTIKIEQMNKDIEKMPYGSAFMLSDFTNNVDYENAKKNAQTLEKKGVIRRVLRGVYDKPKFSKAINEYAVPYPNEIAKAIARGLKWEIAPDGNAALNILSLSTQVPANWSYVSTGPYKKYKINNVTIEFNHRANKELVGMSENTKILIQALKAIGKENINDDIIKKLKNHYKKSEKKEILEESKNTTIWIREVIKKICEE